MSLLKFLWLARVINGRKTPLPACFDEKISLEEFKRYDPNVIFQRFLDKDDREYKTIIIWSNDPSVLFQNLPKCPWMHHTFVETLFVIMRNHIHKASHFKEYTEPFNQDRFQEVWKALQENMEEKA
jgi:hypothetical protein